MQKKFVKTLILGTLILSSALLFSHGITANQNELKVLVNGQEINTEAKLIDDKVYIPLRSVSEALGASVGWDGSTKTASVDLIQDDVLIPEVLKEVSQSVVGIIGTVKDNSDSSSKYKDLIAHGTGVIVKSNGFILTNAHVVKDMEKIVVLLSDGNGYEATQDSIDTDADLALIKIDKTDLKPAKLGKYEDIIIGKTVLAIGTPVSFSLRNSASKGIISGMNRGVSSSYRLIQTDAAINPGNSGGPLVNLHGEVIGINSSKFAGSGIEGVGFSIPIDTVKYVLNQFEKYNKVKRPNMGIFFEEDWAARAGLPTNSGITVLKFEAKSPAKDQGIKENDIILSINEKNINTIVDYNEELKKYAPGDTVLLKLKRDGVYQTMNFVFGEK